MTFSIVGHCARTHMTGVAITTSSICVASRCPWVRAGVGAAATQNITDPSLGPLLLDYVAQGLCAQDAMDKVTSGRESIHFRQLTLVDTRGGSAHFTGTEVLGINCVASGPDCIGAGNLLSCPDVPQAMCDRFAAGAELHLAERLMRALQAGVDAGGEVGPTHSAGLKVAHQQSWPLVDLRVDWSDADPVGELMALWQAYALEMDAYTTRALNPAAAPSYGVPGDL